MLNIPADDRLAVALVEAIHGGDVLALCRQLERDPSLARARIVDRKGVGRTLLHSVADWPGHFPNGAMTVAALVAAGADVNASVSSAKPDGPAETALHWAASSGDLDVLDALLAAGADIDAPGAVFTGGTPMSDAVVFAQWPAARRLLERGAKTTLWQAAALGELGRVRQALTAQPSPPPEDITNAFWHACRGGQLATARELLAHGAAPDWVGHERKTPLAVARESGAADLIAWLEGIDAARGPRG